MNDLEPKIGQGYDLHRLEPIAPEGSGGRFILGGIEIQHESGPVGHSDGDSLLHAVTDALLGAIGEPDIGQLFPDTDPQWHGADSSIFLIEAIKRVAARGLRVGNLDCTVICERPKISPHKDAIQKNLARLLNTDIARINIKGKTHERVDAVGEGRAIEVLASVLLLPTSPA